MADQRVFTKEEEDALLQHGKNSATRLVGIGAEAGDLQAVYKNIRDLKGWYPEFAKLAEKYEEAGNAAKVEYARIFNFMRAAVYHHIGEMFIFTDNEEKKRGQAAMAAAYAKAAKHFAYPMEEVKIAFPNGYLLGYFRRLRGIKKAPCVILVRGVDASKEAELHILSNSLLDQGLFTLAVDAPGQGDTRFRGMKMTPDFEKPIGAAVDYLLSRTDVDPERIGIWGMSFGGFIAPRAAALEKRIRACVSLSGFFGMDEFEFSLTAKSHCWNNMKVMDELEWEQRRKEYSLMEVIRDFSCPLLVITGSAEKVIPVAQSMRIYEQAQCSKDVKIYDGIGHCVFYEEPAVLPFIAAWMRKQLANK